MDRDLNLTGAFGGLRIANPDNLSDASPPISEKQELSEPLHAANLDSSSPPPPPLSSSQQSALSGEAAGGLLGFDPSSYSTDAYASNELARFPSQTISESDSTFEPPPQRATYSANYPPPSPSNPSHPIQTQLPPPSQQQQQPPYSPGIGRGLIRSPSQRNGKRASAIPPGYSPNPAAASAAAAAMSQRQYPNGRPMSTAYGPGQNFSRDDGYRLHKEPSQHSLGPGPGPRRVKSTSRKASEAAQAGVPVNESNHQERNYGSRPPVYGGNVVPPRRQGSRGMLRQGQEQNGPSNGRFAAGSPYALESGPPPSSEEWQERGAAVRVTQTTDADGRPVTKYVKKGVKDFKFGQLLGEGSYSQVHLAQDRSTLTEYAIKVLDKRHIIKEKKVKYVNIEKDTLNRLTNHPGVVRLYYTFQDERSLYFVLDCASNGELLGVLKRMGTFDEECTRYYAAQLLDTIEYMHSRGVIHRDLKPENILLDGNMHTKITDFGTAKILSDPKRSRAGSGANGPQLPPGIAEEAPNEDRANSFVGTAEYVSPELLTEKSACKASDLWAFGCIVYQLLAGRPPFKAGNEYLTFQKIVKLEYRFPTGFPPAARDLIERCLVLDPRQRLTIEHIKNHDFFRGMKFGKQLWQQKAPSLKAYVAPTHGPIRLNGDQSAQSAVEAQPDPNSSFPPDMQPSHSTRPVHIQETSPRSTKPSKRPSPKVITDVPPPSQLDIEWSPILAKDNERILKLGNQAVTVGSARDNLSGHKHGSGDKDGKEEAGGGGGGAFKRFFGGGGVLKKKTRMVMATTNGRLLIANGPDEKKLKFEANLLSEGTSWMKCLDSKGLAYWCLETKDKHFSFEDPKHSTSDMSHTTAQAQEWLEALDRARDAAIGRSATGSVSGFSSLLTSPTQSNSPSMKFAMGGKANDSTSAFSASNFSVGGSGNTGSGGGGGTFTPGSYSAAGSANDLSASRYAPGTPGTSNNATGLVDQAKNTAAPPGSSGNGGRSHLHKPRDGNDADNEDGRGGGMSRGFRRFSKRQSKSGLAAVF